MPSIEKAVHKIILGEYSVLNIYENFGGGDFSPGKIEFGVVVVRVFLVVRVSIPGVNCVSESDLPGTRGPTTGPPANLSGRPWTYQ